MIWSIDLFFLDSLLSLKNCPYLLGCQICGLFILLIFFCISAYLLTFLLFHFSCCLFEIFLSSSWWVCPEVCQFCLPFQRTSSWFYWLFLLFSFISILLISSLIFMISFCWLQVFFVFILYCFVFFLFLVLLGGRLSCWYEIFLLFWGRPVSLWTSF